MPPSLPFAGPEGQALVFSNRKEGSRGVRTLTQWVLGWEKGRPGPSLTSWDWAVLCGLLILLHTLLEIGELQGLGYEFIRIAS